eukprot:Skav216858  [mRNA]  locus=scaffold1042:104269:114021:- [translate_table: standard]
MARSYRCLAEASETKGTAGEPRYEAMAPKCPGPWQLIRFESVADCLSQALAGSVSLLAVPPSAAAENGGTGRGRGDLWSLGVTAEGAPTTIPPTIEPVQEQTRKLSVKERMARLAAAGLPPGAVGVQMWASQRWQWEFVAPAGETPLAETETTAPATAAAPRLATAAPPQNSAAMAAPKDVPAKTPAAVNVNPAAGSVFGAAQFARVAGATPSVVSSVGRPEEFPTAILRRRSSDSALPWPHTGVLADTCGWGGCFGGLLADSLAG